MAVNISPPALNSSFLAPGVITKEITAVVDMTTAAASFTIAETIPAGSVVISAAMSVQNTIQAATAVKIGLGRLTATADPDKYLLSTALTAEELAKPINQWATPLTAEETLAVFACDTNGAAAGTIGGGADDAVIVRIVYLRALPI